MRPLRVLTLLASVLLAGPAVAPRLTAQPPAGPFTPENKPWTRWWWPGSGVDRASLTHQLEQFAAAGLGGVEITPIYGASGYEDRYIPYLSPQWVEMLAYVGSEAKRLGLRVDMANGTGWPFGGPWIDPAHALEKVALQDGRLVGVPTGMKVKRAAPGGEGLVVDPYSVEAIQQYLAPFDRAFASLPAGTVRSQFHDSFEYFDASWTPRFAEAFQAMHGYDIQAHAAELLGQQPVDADTLARLKSDYRDTLAQLHLDYLHAWVQWSHQHGFLVRNQSHGAPGNLLDLYANADIAETEVFGSTPFPIPGLRRNAEDVRHDQDLPESLVIRMASSAGHVVGHNLTSSETFTWLRDHWKVALSYTKPEVDRLFTDGVNHIFIHGAVFSPQDVPWPGWLFYAATQFNPNNPWWGDVGGLTQYITRVQSVLQAGQPDNDILLYWPIEDIWNDPNGLMVQLAVHNVKWLTEQPVGRLGQALMDHGYSFDYISDAQLQTTRVEHGALVTPGGRYRVLVVPAAHRMPARTLRQIAQLAAGGAKVVFQALPEDVPGLGRLEERRAAFQQALAQVKTHATIAAEVVSALPNLGAVREPVADHGIRFIRRKTGLGYAYFFANLTGHRLDGWVALGRSAAEDATLTDPLTGVSGHAARQVHHDARDRVYLQLEPGQSVLLHVRGAPAELASFQPLGSWPYRATAGAPIALAGEWQISFLKGGPELPAPIRTHELKSWTELGGEAAQRFGGTARYRLEFDAPTVPADDWLLTLGDVRETARVRLNGKDVALAWSLPFQLRVGPELKPGRNVLELDVTNLAANRIRDLDRRGVKWKIMREINFVNINYQPFDASRWPLTPSGLLGPVTLTPLKALAP